VVRVEDIQCTPLHYVFNPDHYIGIVIDNTTLLYKSKPNSYSGFSPFPVYGMVKQAHSLLDNLNQTVMQVSLPFPIYGTVKQTII
jgi:hypothetical protein